LNRRLNGFSVDTTHGERRLFDAMTEKDFIPHYKKTIFSWSQSASRFLLRSTEPMQSQNQTQKRFGAE
jgi:hypothetical protein